MPHIYVLFTTFPDPLSRFFRFAGRLNYSHASIALEEDQDTYYSFNLRGFAVETREKFRRRGILRDLRLKIAVSDQSYQSIRERLINFRANRSRYQYTLMGAILCLLHCPIQRERCYFCSQFVAETLGGARAVRLKRRPCGYSPRHLQQELQRLPQLCAMQANVM